MRFKLFVLALCVALLNGCDESARQTEVATQKQTIQRTNAITVLLDLHIDAEGKVIAARLAEGQANTMFAKAALMQVKTQQFAVRYEDGKAVSYWLYNTVVTVGQVVTVKPDAQ